MVECDDIVFGAMDPPKVPYQDGGYRAQENAIRRHEIQETTCAGEDLPGYKDPSYYGAKKLSAADVDV